MAEPEFWQADHVVFKTREEWLKAAEAYGAKVSIRKVFLPEGLEQAIVGDPLVRERSASLGEWHGSFGWLFPDDDCRYRAETYKERS